MKLEATSAETKGGNKKENNNENDYLEILQNKLKNLTVNEDKLIERGPTKSREKYGEKIKPYDFQYPYIPYLPHNHNHQSTHSLPPLYIPSPCGCTTTTQKPTGSDEEAVTKALSLTPEQILGIANAPEFRKFVETLCGDNAKGLRESEGTRRLSTDSSYYSDTGSMPATPEKSCFSPESPEQVKCVSERERFRESLDKGRKRVRWVEVNTLDEEEVFVLDEDGRSRLHVLLDSPPEDLKEAFYANVELMKSQDGKEFLKVVEAEPSLVRICQRRYPELVNYLIETIDSLK